MKPPYEKNDIIDGKYRVDGLCSDSGGMGTILFVTLLKAKGGSKVVLKYCKDADEEQLKRFRREVRLLATFKGNEKVVQVVDQNLDHDPPYFVMKYYPDGDLSQRGTSLSGSYAAQEQCFLQMIDCIRELHAKNIFHRDIKAQNFLVDGDRIVVSDFGLTTEIGSNTAFTRSSAWWGTHGHIPPEFMHAGGFKRADAPGDIFMLGKTLYSLLTDRDPLYIVGDGVPPPLLYIIERCCSVAKDGRYQTLSQLKQSLVAAYDVLLDRAGGLGKVRQLLSAIEDRLEQEAKYRSADVVKFLEQLGLLEEGDQGAICRDLSPRFFSIVGQQPFAGSLAGFLRIYEKMVAGQNYSWSFAETIAANMRAIFDRDTVPPGDRARALQLAIRAASYMNRFAAMDICTSMVTSIEEESLGFHVAAVLIENRETFISRIEVSACQCEAIRSAVRQIRQG
jgi:eukaryotic-like serine/threonine-protein kinase